MPTLFRQTKPHPLPATAEIVDKGGKPHARIREGKQTKLYPLTKDGNRYLRPTAVWCAMVRGADGRRKPVRLSPNKDAAAVLLAKMLTEIEQEKAGIRRPAPLGSASAVLSVLVAEYRTSCGDRGTSHRHADQAVTRCRSVFTGCRFITLADLDATAIERWLSGRRAIPRAEGGFGAQTSNHYVTSLKAFGNWLVRTGRESTSPFRHLTKGNVDVDVRHERRPLTPEEFDRLLTAAAAGRPYRGLAGEARVVLYTIAAFTGLRASELASLTPASFALDATTPSVTVGAAYSKHKRRDTVPLHSHLVHQLRPWLLGKEGDGLLWAGKWAKQFTAAAMLKRDLDTARTTWIAEGDTTEERTRREKSDFLAYEDANGEKADFHALRHKFITELVKAGVQPKDAKELARHSTIVLTMDRYAHVTLKDTAAALAKLAGPTVTSGRGVAPGVAEKGNEQVQSGAMEEADPPDLSPSGETVVTLNPLPSQGVESERGHPVAIQKAEREGFEPSLPLPVNQFSRLTHSTTLPPLRAVDYRDPVAAVKAFFPARPTTIAV